MKDIQPSSSIIESSQFVIPSSPLARKSLLNKEESRLNFTLIEDQIMNTSDIVSEDEYIFEYPQTKNDTNSITHPILNSNNNSFNSLKESTINSDDEVLHILDDNSDNEIHTKEHQSYKIDSIFSYDALAGKVDAFENDKIRREEGSKMDSFISLASDHKITFGDNKSASKVISIIKNKNEMQESVDSEKHAFTYKSTSFKIHKHSATIMSPLISKMNESVLPLKRTAQVMQQIAKKNNTNQARHIMPACTKKFIERPSTGLYRTAVTNSGTPLYFPYTNTAFSRPSRKSNKLLEIDIYTSISNVKQEALFKENQQTLLTSLSSKETKNGSKIYKKVKESQLWVDKYSVKKNSIFYINH